jgi:quercetin dioxygenase-like cupin family protein
VKKRLIIALSASALVAAGVSLAAGAAPSPIVATILGGASVAKPYTIRVTKPSDLVFVKAKVLPHGNLGWHYHRGAVAVAVLSGTLTLYDSSVASCSPQQYSAGQGFIEQKGHVHLARNETDKPVQIVVTYLGAPHGVPLDVPAKESMGCSVD